ncbi:hypothetical protein Hanom_Chr14g01326381 [Helianthus anomalus]
MFVHLTNRTKFLVHVRSYIKQTNIKELPAERFTNCSLNVRFVYSPTNWSSCECWVAPHNFDDKLVKTIRNPLDEVLKPNP